MKTRTLLIAAVMFLGLTAASFAQATFSVGSIPVTAVVQTGLTEKAGDITFTAVSGTSVAGSITISYGVPITEPFPSETTNALNVVTVTGPAGVAINSAASNHAAGVLVISIPAGVTAASGQITVSGVRVAVAGTTLTNLNATITAFGNAITANQTTVLVIASVGPGIGSVNATASGSATARILGTTGQIFNPNASTLIVGTTGVAGHVVLKEGFLDAWDNINPATSAGLGLQFTLSANPPAGVTIQFPATVSTDGVGSPTFVTYNSDRTRKNAVSNITSSSSSLSVFYRLESATDPTKVETADFPITIIIDTTTVTLPLPVQLINFTVTLWPTGTAFNSDGTVITTSSLIPRYVSSLLGPFPLFQIVQSTTTILFPFVQTAIAAGNYNTGLAIANTTLDPGVGQTGFVSPTPQSGPITFWFFPQQPSPTATAPTPFSYTTSATSPGTGLDATGKLPGGSTYTVLLSQLLQAAAKPVDFAGSLYAIVNATNAHGLFVLSNFTTFSQGGYGLIIPQDRTLTPEALNN